MTDQITFCGVSKTFKEWAKVTGLTVKDIENQFKNGVNPKQILTNNLNNDAMKRLAEIVNSSSNKAMKKGEIIMAEEEMETEESAVEETENNQVEESAEENASEVADNDGFEDEFTDEEESEAEEETEEEAEEEAEEESEEETSVKATASSTPAGASNGSVSGKGKIMSSGKQKKAKAEDVPKEPKKRGRKATKNVVNDSIILDTQEVEIDESNLTIVRKKSSQIKVFKNTQEEVKAAMTKNDDGKDMMTIEAEEALEEVPAKPSLRQINEACDLGVSEEGHNTRQFGKKVMDAIKKASEPNEVEEEEKAEVTEA